MSPIRRPSSGLFWWFPPPPVDSGCPPAPHDPDPGF